jgi:excisionase family DNA binding protein
MADISPPETQGVSIRSNSRATAKSLSSSVLDSLAAAAHLGLGINALLGHARSGEIPASRRGRIWRFRRADLEAWLESETTQQTNARRESR